MLSSAAAGLQSLDQLADVRFDGLDHRGVNGHQMIEAVFRFLGERVPRGRLRFAGAQRPTGINQPHLDLAAVTRFTQPVPTGPVSAAVFGDQVRRRHQRKVRRVVRQVEEERLVCRARFVDELQSEIGPQVRGVPVLAEHGRIARRRRAVEVQRLRGAAGKHVAAALEILIGEEHATGAQTEHPFEPALPGWRPVVLTEMPFTGHRGEVAGLA